MSNAKKYIGGIMIAICLVFVIVVYCMFSGKGSSTIPATATTQSTNTRFPQHVIIAPAYGSWSERVYIPPYTGIHPISPDVDRKFFRVRGDDCVERMIAVYGKHDDKWNTSWVQFSSCDSESIEIHYWFTPVRE